MPRKPGSMYRRVRGKLSTRKEYMGGIPNSRITQFVLGNKKAEFPITISLTANEECQVRHNALEAARITGNRTMDKKAGAANYRLTVRTYPHVVLRENKQATGAGADRVSQGMRSSWGKIVSVAAKVNRNQIIMTIETTEQNIQFAKDALRKAGMKIPSPCKVQIIKDN
ncbi:MAG: 50S ribosomal protein L16 [Thermoplasmatales archaeon]|nr:50S ribosomal protein L16 [Thermoplasmatales archaeon]